MSRCDLGIKHSSVLQPAYGPHVSLLKPMVYLVGCFGYMKQLREVVRARQRCRLAQDIGRTHVEGMWRRYRHDQVVALPARDKVRGIAQTLLIRGRVRGGELDDRLPAYTAHACLDGRPGDLLLKVVHVGKAGGPAAHHLGAGQRRTKEAELGVHKLMLHRQDVPVEPHVQAQVVGQTAQDAHRQVPVRVDEPRHDDLPAAIHDIVGLPAGAHLGGWANRSDRVATNSHCAGIQNAPLAVHGDDRAAVQQNIRALYGSCRLGFHCHVAPLRALGARWPGHRTGGA